MNQELPDVQAGFRKGRGTKDQIDNICWIIKKAREFQKNICLLTTPKPLTVWITANYGKFLKTWEYQMTWPASHEICMQVKKQQLNWTWKTDWFHIGKEVHQDSIWLACSFDLYVEYIMKNARLDETQARIKISRRSINNLRCTDLITLMAESEEELKSLFLKVKEESERVGVKLRKLISWHLVPSLHGKQMGKKWKQWESLFWGAPKSLQIVTAAMKLKDTYSLEEKLWPT